MGNYTIFYMFENPRRGRQARNFATNVSKILDLNSSSEQIFFRRLSLGAPASSVEDRSENKFRQHLTCTIRACVLKPIELNILFDQRHNNNCMFEVTNIA